jgi:hypothetical protein
MTAVFQGVSRKKSIPAVLPCEMNFLKVDIPSGCTQLAHPPFLSHVSPWCRI